MCTTSQVHDCTEDRVSIENGLIDVPWVAGSEFMPDKRCFGTLVAAFAS